MARNADYDTSSQTKVFLPGFDEERAIGLAEAINGITGLGCTLFAPADDESVVIYAKGSCSKHCPKCASHPDGELWDAACQRTHSNAVSLARSFGGQYTYLCPQDRIFVAAVIFSGRETIAAVTVGPVHIYEEEETVQGYPGLEPFPVRDSCFVDQLSALFSSALFSLSGYDPSVASGTAQSEAVNWGRMGGSLARDRIVRASEYDIERERDLFEAVKQGERSEALRILDHIIDATFSSSTGRGEYVVQERFRELVVVVSRAAMLAGAHSEVIDYAAGQCTRELRFLTSPEQIKARMQRFVDEAAHFVNRLRQVGFDDVMFTAEDYIYNHYREKITLDDMARLTDYSPSYFSRLFKEKAGCSFTDYLSQVRVQSSKADLATTDLSIPQIAARSGFSSANYFTRVFKRVTGITPAYYRAHRGARGESLR